MLASIVVYLESEVTHPLSPSIARSVHGLFLKLLREGNIDLAKELHDKQGVKPFTISTLYGKFGRTSIQRLIVKDFEYWIRFTLLTEDSFKTFSKVIFPLAAEQGKIFLNGQKFRVKKALLEVEENGGWSGLSNYAGIIEEASNSKMKEDAIFVQFYSPTTFRQGKTNYILPEPSLVFGSWLNKWNAFCEIPLPAEIKSEVKEKVVVAEFRLRSAYYNLDDHQLMGFQGRCKYDLTNAEEQLKIYLHALSSYSFYAGTGQKTTMGMGMTRRWTTKNGGK